MDTTGGGIKEIATNKEQLILKAEAIGYPVEINKLHYIRTIPQNKLQQLWHGEAASQLKDETAEEKRGYAKLNIGCNILLTSETQDAAEWRESFEMFIRPLSYEDRLKAMMEPIDFPVTRFMTRQEKKLFLDQLYHHYKSQGVMLTEPSDLRRKK